MAKSKKSTSSSAKIPCTVGIITLNNQDSLATTLESINDFAEIIICDGNSTDDTIKIAKKYGCKIIPQYPSQKKNIKVKDKSIVRNKTIKAATQDWYFYIDSDDIASKQLVKDIKKVCSQKNPGHYIWKVNCQIQLGDRLIKYSSSYPDHRVMLIHKSTGAKFYKSEHEAIKYDTTKYSAGLLKGKMILRWPHDRAGFKYWKKANEWLDRDFHRVKDMSFRNFIRWGIWFNLTTSAMYLVKSIKNYLFYGFSQSMPPSVELFRVLYHLKMMSKLTLHQANLFLRSK